MKHALIIFVKNFVLGQVKTRLAATLGNEEALDIYKQLVQHTQQITAPVPAEKNVFYSDALEEQHWPQTAKHNVQQGTDLGQRMAWAFEKVFKKGAEKVVIIGSDCLELTTAIIEQAFTELENCDVVMGPAKDGGYYLLGLKQHCPELFRNMEWSTASVRSQTVHACQRLALSVSLLPELADIDEAEDWIQAKAILYAK